ncbi:hypothetical protein AFUB_048580 [Aspergillus fumigatus A1163]|uniref:Uncharacterized protein n=1 Tax=Aspergillus fumigatus (strain CBS 144.89 / FGSC A1163 / CEA10) TaxID=451804 RepID=B0XXR5_ASPFC|nr:hypothetical protein AFUB_048580 [Aspergillus fumigatus A1163]
MIRAEVLDKGSVSGSNKPLRDIIFSFLYKGQSILEVVVATIVLSHIIPDSTLGCRIEKQWQTYFQTKNSDAIRTIQDKLHCCGLRSLHDRAWPFKDRDHGDNTCEVQIGYKRSCFSPWKEQQQLTSSMVVVAALLSWLCRVHYACPNDPRNTELDAQWLCDIRFPGSEPKDITSRILFK